jgi:hypothetical protein
MQEFECTLRVAIIHHRLDHATKRYACGFDEPAAHLLPATPNSIHVVSMTIGFDEAAASVTAVDEYALVSFQLLQLLGQQGGLPNANTGFDNR